MSKAHTHISPYGWVMIMLLLILGAINFADKAVLGLAIVTFGSAFVFCLRKENIAKN